jgi:hypothetical protein
LFKREQRRGHGNYSDAFSVFAFWIADQIA